MLTLKNCFEQANVNTLMMSTEWSSFESYLFSKQSSICAAKQGECKIEGIPTKI